MTDNNGIIDFSFAPSVQTEHSTAKAYRLARRNGELVLQGCFLWTCGSDYGHVWRDIPIVDLDTPALATNQR